MTKQIPSEIEQLIKSFDFPNTDETDETQAQLLLNNLTEYLNLSDENHILNLVSEYRDYVPDSNQMQASITTLIYPETNTAKYDAVLSLFSDFYRYSPESDQLLQQLSKNLNEYGLGVIDVFNTEKVLTELKAEEIKTINNIEFHIRNQYTNGHIISEIQFEKDENSYTFTNQTLALTLQDFENMMSGNNFFLLDIFGDYKLKKFHKYESDRLIMIFK